MAPTAYSPPRTVVRVGSFIDQKIPHLTKDMEEDEKEEFVLSRRLDAGLYTLQMVDVVLAHLIVARDGGVYERVKAVLNQHDATIGDVKGHLETYHAELDDEADGGAATKGEGLKARLFKLIQAI